MARVCQVTGATPGFGNTISHSHRRSKRRFNLNVQKKTYWVPSLGRKVTLTVSARGIKTIDRRGIDAVVAAISSEMGICNVKEEQGSPPHHQDAFDGRHRVHVRNSQEPPQQPGSACTSQVRPGCPSAC